MIAYDLRCDSGHVFEAWFGSSASYEDQRTRSLVACPICGTTAIGKAMMAPNIPAKANRSTAITPDQAKTALKALAAAQAGLLERSEWVGRGFATRARAMHDGDEPHATIHGQVTPTEAKAVVEDGVPVAPLPLPVVPPKATN